jgi:hypothetical protein
LKVNRELYRKIDFYESEMRRDKEEEGVRKILEEKLMSKRDLETSRSKMSYLRIQFD